MGSLNAHLRRPEDHGRLAFHPECPVCRSERLVGALPAEALVSRRTQALLAAGVLALSTTTPTAVLAAEPDHEQEGAAAPAPDRVPVVDPRSQPDFDPGGASTDLPFDAGPAPDPQAAADPNDDSDALEPEPATNADAPVADSGDGSSTPGQLPTPPATAPVAATTPAPAPPPSDPSTGAPAPATPTATPAPSDTDAAARPQARTREAARKKTPPPRHASTPPSTAPASVTAPSAVSTPGTAPVAQRQPAPAAPAAVSHGRPARRGDPFHVVRRGESLWSIANDLLGDGASAAATAREVNRLWELNSDRIGTGNPDLLMVGTKLALR